ncbi:hypothetical protein E2C01_027138 [Portunus trituberculatus]|uniref:Uncharacterized protein n=1 Tax=Portunus trituberculatus TaxID=210409 RepID=A0A5B7EMZ2_PORTR|nr:hypothetical protein [Portunus trituberculatus]
MFGSSLPNPAGLALLSSSVTTSSSISILPCDGRQNLAMNYTTLILLTGYNEHSMTNCFILTAISTTPSSTRVKGKYPYTLLASNRLTEVEWSSKKVTATLLEVPLPIICGTCAGLTPLRLLAGLDRMQENVILMTAAAQVTNGG